MSNDPHIHSILLLDGTQMAGKGAAEESLSVAALVLRDNVVEMPYDDLVSAIHHKARYSRISVVNVTEKTRQALSYTGKSTAMLRSRKSSDNPSFPTLILVSVASGATRNSTERTAPLLTTFTAMTTSWGDTAWLEESFDLPAQPKNANPTPSSCCGNIINLGKLTAVKIAVSKYNPR